MITTQELAKIARVSQSTVSRSLNDSPDISDATKERIRKLATEHGYVPRKRVAHNRRGSDMKGIGILLNPDFFEEGLNHYWEALFNALYLQIEREGYYAVLFTCGPHTLEHMKRLDRAGSLCGYIVLHSDAEQKIERYLTDSSLPHVFTQYYKRPLQNSVNIVDLDHSMGGHIATNHLLSLGHRQIATLTAPGSAYEERTAGYIAALTTARVHGRPLVVQCAAPSYTGAYRAAGANWNQLRHCSAIFAQNDAMAIGLMCFLLDKGLRLPQECSVVGFDGISEGVFCRPALTTVAQPLREIAQLSVARLLQLIRQEETKSTHSFVQPSLEVRASSAPPPFGQGVDA